MRKKVLFSGEKDRRKEHEAGSWILKKGLY
jgi:hypothetical protein